ncbi:unnamed protein product [Ectocarpus sp. 12 AP-2014]
MQRYLHVIHGCVGMHFDLFSFFKPFHISVRRQLLASLFVHCNSFTRSSLHAHCFLRFFVFFFAFVVGRRVSHLFAFCRENERMSERNKGGRTDSRSLCLVYVCVVLHVSDGVGRITVCCGELDVVAWCWRNGTLLTPFRLPPTQHNKQTKFFGTTSSPYVLSVGGGMCSSLGLLVCSDGLVHFFVFVLCGVRNRACLLFFRFFHVMWAQSQVNGARGDVIIKYFFLLLLFSLLFGFISVLLLLRFVAVYSLFAVLVRLVS